MDQLKLTAGQQLVIRVDALFMLRDKAPLEIAAMYDEMIDDVLRGAWNEIIKPTLMGKANP